ncbi:hypothetical protein M4914_15280 [Streptomyces somaliensis DSM 40738]|uniref:hypothetical protein n=1 Tax=Streptomyces somaliensis TaxID=78355 RepID=UPI0021C29721|nr:hypothetical protein [Streptomyces somaliensis]MCQ0024182.1 hypothetical protein [Streptomyces somaliensis DSM 40738]
MASSAGSAQGRLTEVVAAAVEVAAEAGESGTYTAETARALTAMVGKIGARISDEAETHGFASGWQEAVAHLGRAHPEPDDARTLPACRDGNDEP